MLFKRSHKAHHPNRRKRKANTGHLSSNVQDIHYNKNSFKKNQGEIQSTKLPEGKNRYPEKENIYTNYTLVAVLPH